MHERNKAVPQFRERLSAGTWNQRMCSKTKCVQKKCVQKKIVGIIFSRFIPWRL